MKKTILFLFAAIVFIAYAKNETCPNAPKSGSLWTIEKAKEWYAGVQKPL